LAADMGGIGYISSNHASIARNNSLMNIHMLDAALQAGARRFFFSSTACVYRLSLQRNSDITSLSEDMAHPAEPEEGYGWEKIYMEKMCEYYREQFGLETRVARFHNVYGPCGTYDGGREKAPAATCRKVALAQDGGEVEVWGDGQQTRSFMYIDDCVKGVHLLTQSDYASPMNLGRQDLISIDGLVDLVAGIAGKRLTKSPLLAWLEESASRQDWRQRQIASMPN
jgi:nucleoside-diphosphate-sugar epimerase